MSGSYKQCSECGKRALRVATRCPGCGGEFPPRPEPSGNGALRVGRSLPVPVLLGLATAGIVALASLVECTLETSRTRSVTSALQ